MSNAGSTASKDPTPYILPGLASEKKLEIFLYASEQYHEAIPKAKSDGVKRLLQHHLEFCSEFVDVMSEFLSNGYNENLDFERLNQIDDETKLEALGFGIICGKYPIEDRRLVENTTDEIKKFAKKTAEE